MIKTLLEVENLDVVYGTSPPVHAVDKVSFTLVQGDNLGIVGESGCGKTTLAKALLGLLARNGSVTGGQILWKGENITHFRQHELERIRWKEIALIPQNAMNSLDPVYRLRDQIVEAILTHEDTSKEEAFKRASALCSLVGIDPERLMDYPHQLSGGMKQRLVIAMALALNPKLIIADEPTTALDVIVQDRILKQIVDLQQRFRFAMIYISHDIGIIAETCHQIAIMYAGKIVEYGDIVQVLKQPAHPYTMGLKNAFPDIRTPKQLISIPGHPPNLAPPPYGCRFAARCPFVTNRCREQEPPLIMVANGHQAACHYIEKAAEFRRKAELTTTWEEVVAGEHE